MLLDADVVDAVLEGHVDRRTVEATAAVDRPGRALERLELRQLRSVVRVGLRLEHLLGAPIALRQARRHVGAQLLRPRRVVEDALVGAQ
ncbi:MAG TPA: hypothetical protein VFF79_19810 [Conexibacter sp.]|nr:hypothetical protein [Conexibacter sp.]